MHDDAPRTSRPHAGGSPGEAAGVGSGPTPGASAELGRGHARPRRRALALVGAAMVTSGARSTSAASDASPATARSGSRWVLRPGDR